MIQSLRIDSAPMTQRVTSESCSASAKTCVLMPQRPASRAAFSINGISWTHQRRITHFLRVPLEHAVKFSTVSKSLTSPPQFRAPVSCRQMPAPFRLNQRDSRARPNSCLRSARIFPQSPSALLSRSSWIDSYRSHHPIDSVPWSSPANTTRLIQDNR